MRPLILIISATLFLPGARAQNLSIDRAAQAVSGMQAQFTQRFTPRGFKNSQTESGSVLFGRQPMMRWSYETPEKKLFVFDGDRSWFYVPAENQVTVAEIDERRRAELPFLLLGDPVARNKHFIVRQQNKGGTVSTTLQARDGAAPVRQVAVTTNVRSHLIESIQYTDRDGNRTSFTFTGYRPAALNAETFRFTPPAGVQVIRAD